MASDTTATIEMLKIIVPGAIGAASALLGQLIANIFADRRHAIELRQRDAQNKVQFLSPLATRRMQAFETIYELIQKAVEEKQIKLADYEHTRPLFLYLDPPLRETVVNALTNLIRASNSRDQNSIACATAALKLAQDQVENDFGQSHVAKAVRQLINDTEGK